jgi:hypothetical protein
MLHTSNRPIAFAAILSCLGGAATAQSASWVLRSLTPHPSSNGATTLAYDAARGECLFFSYARETWTYDGVAWDYRGNQQGPTNGIHPGGSCFDAARQVVVMVAGNQSTGQETWEWNGTAWSRRLVGGLPGRHSFALAYDAARGKTLLFGGSRGASVGLADTWEWDGSTWTQVYNGGPPPRSDAAMVYDAARQTVVLFGGDSDLGGSSIRYDDTWEWNGQYWIGHYGIPAPAGRYSHEMVYDSARQRVVLYGGTTGQSSLQDTWEWDGLAWTQTVASGGPAGVYGMAYDSSRAVAVAVHGPSASQTSEYVTAAAQAATFTTFGAGCVGPNGTPSLGAAPGSTPRIGATLQLSLSNLPTSFLNPAFGIVGFDATTWNGQPLPVSLASIGMPGCAAWIDSVLAEVLLNVQGTASWNIAIPMNQNFVGLNVYVQGAVLSPGSNAAGVVLSNAGHARIGSF